MFSTGQLIFSIFFVVVFTFFIIYSYKKDIKKNREYFKGTYWVFIVFLLFIVLLIFIKNLVK